MIKVSFGGENSVSIIPCCKNYQLIDCHGETSQAFHVRILSYLAIQKENSEEENIELDDNGQQLDMVQAD